MVGFPFNPLKVRLLAGDLRAARFVGFGDCRLRSHVDEACAN